MKRIIALILVLCTLVFSATMLFSCQPDDSESGNSGGNNSGGNISGDVGDGGGNTGNDENESGNGGGNSSDNTDGGNVGEDYEPDCSNGDHIDKDNDKYCDLCKEYVIVVIDFYVLNDLHGKFCDTNNQPGLDELGTYLKLKEQSDDNVVIMSSGDMWQGTAESNLTGGVIITEWMNEMNFVSMTLGNHEYDWGEDDIKNNLAVADFPFLAINIYDNKTNALADYCSPSVMVERDGVKIGIIGAIGDCYSSISADMVEDVRFKVKNELTELVKAESDRLRAAGADLIVYSLHDGYGDSKSGTSSIGSLALASYYDTVLSNGYVDLVFEAHSHQRYILKDMYGVYHLQGGGENSGLSHVEIEVNSANGSNKVTEANFISNSTYINLDDDPVTEAIEDKYKDVIDYANSPLGVVSRTYSDSEVEDYVAGLYLKVGTEKWGEEYDIVLGGGYLKTRSPYNLSLGTKTYADVLSILPFDNRLVLCSVSGAKLSSQFINTSNGDYHIALSEYGESIKNNISSYEQYYVIVDTYTAYYAPNGLTIVDFYDDDTYARDLLAEEIKAGNFEIKQNGYTLTSIPDALEIGEGLADNKSTTKYYWVKGTIKSAPNDTYGNLTLVDDYGNEIYVYGLYNSSGDRYDSMSDKPVKNDVIVVSAVIKKYVKDATTIIELVDAVVVEKNP